MPLDYGPTNHPRPQGAGWLHEALIQLCTSWPRRWDYYVPVATWIHRVTPDPSVPGGASPCRILLGRDPRSHIDVVSASLDDASYGQARLGAGRG